MEKGADAAAPPFFPPGRLELATAASAGFGLSRAEMRKLQERRVARLSFRLAHQLQSWVDGTEQQRQLFREAAATEAAALAEVSFGAAMLHTIGYVYVNKAEQFLGNPLCIVKVEDLFSPVPVTSVWAALEQKIHVWGTQLELGWAGLQAVLAAKAVAEAEAEESEQESGVHKAEVMKKVADLLPSFVEALWRHTVLDIETTTRHVCSKARAPALRQRSGASLRLPQTPATASWRTKPLQRLDLPRAGAVG